MKFTRRESILIAAGATATALLPLRVLAAGEEEIAAFTGGAAVGEGGITLTAPEIAENGNTVPVEVNAPGAVSVMLLALGNPNPAVATINFGPLAGAQYASTRIRLSKTQTVTAIAKMADGSFAQASSEIKVTIGGCGG
jgi:sulfur-oxidizing protein SoxY